MRIGLDYRPVTAAPTSGIAKQVLALEQALNNAQHTVILLTDCPETHVHRRTCVCPPWSTDGHGLHRPVARWKFERDFLPKALHQQQLDMYIATANMGLPLQWHSGAIKQVLLLHDVFQLTTHNRHHSWLKKWVYRLIDWSSIAYAVFRADRVLTPSAYSASEIVRLFATARTKITVLPNAVTFSPLASPAKPNDLPDRYWLLVGTREPRKNIPWFIRHWQLARARDAAVPALVLVGQAQDLPADLQNLEGVIFKQQLSEEALNTLYFHAEYLWQPSYAEGFGLPVIEALAQGTAVVVAQGSALQEVAPPDAARFSPTDGQALIELILQYTHAPRDRSDSVRLQAWAQQFDMSHYQQRLQDVILRTGDLP